MGIPYEAEYQGEGTGSALHIYNEEGEEVLTYTQGVGWHEKETKAETGVHSALKLAYYEAYHDARKALNTGTNVEITNENVDDILSLALTKKFVNVLEDAGVFKMNDEGIDSFYSFC